MCRLPSWHDAAPHQVLRGYELDLLDGRHLLGCTVCQVLEGGLCFAALHHGRCGLGDDGNEHLVSCMSSADTCGSGSAGCVVKSEDVLLLSCFTCKRPLTPILGYNIYEQNSGKDQHFCWPRCICCPISLIMFCRYFDFVNFNSTGLRPYVTTFYAVLLGSLRKTLSRILVLIVSMGFGVLLPYLGAIQKKAMLCSSACDTVRQHLDVGGDESSACACMSKPCSSSSKSRKSFSKQWDLGFYCRSLPWV